MITWMQRHRKYLVVTIWISTIAFVGAGFVGWGAYSFNSNSTSVAKVGDNSINYQQFNLAYSNSYSYYNKLFGGKFNQELAEQMNLKQSVLNSLIDEALMLSLAQDLGLIASDDDVKNRLANEKSFQTNGAFDITRYRQILGNMMLKEKDYEQVLKRQIVLDRLDKIISLAKPRSLEPLASALFMEDRLAIDIITSNPNSIKIGDKELKKYWEGKKENFLTQKSYDIQESFINLNSIKSVSDKELKELYEEKKFSFLDKQGKVKSFDDAKDDVLKAVKFAKAKKIALKRYLKIKKNEENLSKNLNILDNIKDYPLTQLASANNGDVLKPYKLTDGYKIIKLIKVNLPKIMSFKQAKDQVLQQYKMQKNEQLLTTLAKEKLNTFNGKDIGFVSRDLNTSMQGLTKLETNMFVSKLFTKNDKKSYVILGNKAVIYKILEQKLLDKEKLRLYNKNLTKSATSLENDEMRNNLLAMLRKRYKVEQFVDFTKGK